MQGLSSDQLFQIQRIFVLHNFQTHQSLNCMQQQLFQKTQAAFQEQWHAQVFAE